MQNKNPKKNIGAGIIGIAVVIIGILWTFSAISMTRNSPFGPAPSILLPSFGVVFVTVGIVNTVKIFKGEIGDEQESAETGANRNNQEELVKQIAGALKETQQKKAENWTCAYCATLVDGEAVKCPSCGAGRNQVVHSRAVSSVSQEKHLQQQERVMGD